MLQSAGERDRLIKIMAPTLVRDAHNQPTTTYTQAAEVWASWRRAGANERLASSQAGAQVTDVFEALWSPTMALVDPNYRVIYGGRTYDVIEATEIGFREGVLIRAAAQADERT